jgi:hypothetical protein
MAVQHSTITDPNIHEPKGVSSAAAGKVYVANGAGSGSWQYPAGYAHGEIYINAGATTQTLSVSSGYAKLNPTGEWTAGESAVMTLDPTNGEITLTEGGVYLINFWLQFSTAAIASGTTYNFKYAFNGTTAPRTLTVSKYSNSSDKLHISAAGLASATAGQKLSIYVGGDATSSGTIITPLEGGLSVVRLKEA